MEQFEQKFKDDAADLIKTLEEDLLLLKHNPNDKKISESIFRTIHTLKGAGAMFGYENISKMSHDIEGIYSLIQEEKLKASEEIIKLTFNAIDFYKYFLEHKIITDTKDKSKFDNFLIAINNLAGKNNYTENNTFENITNTEKTYYIKFTPKADFEERGINLFGIFDELETLGTVERFDRETKPENNPNDVFFYLFWEIILSTDKDISEVEEMFIFFENQAEIIKLKDGNLFTCEEFIEKIENLKDTQKLIDIEELKNIDSCKTAEPEKNKNTDINDFNIRKKDENITTFSKYKTASIRVSSEKLDELMNLVSEFITTKATIDIIAQKHEIKELEGVSEKLENLVKKFQENALTIRLVPLRNMLIDIERLIISLGKKLGKNVSFVSQGTETELDKSIIDNLSEPIIHIIRNSIDHGIETEEERIAKGKSPQGQIKFIAFHSAGNVFIQIHDDGCGVNLEKIRKKAVSKGLLSPKDRPSKAELYNFIFYPGFSTTKSLTDVSGRGMGMDIVKQKIQELRGDVEVNSEKDLGTYITLKLPVTLSIIDTLHIIIGKRDLLIPSYLVVNLHTVKNSEILQENKSILEINNEPMPILNLIKKYGLEGEKPEFIKIVVVKFKDKNYGLIVSDIIGAHQAVLKPLGEVFNKQETFSGASILGNGKIALILNTNKLIPNIK